MLNRRDFTVLLDYLLDQSKCLIAAESLAALQCLALQPIERIHVEVR